MAQVTSAVLDLTGSAPLSLETYLRTTPAR